LPENQEETKEKLSEQTLILSSSLHDFKEIIKIYCNS